MRRRPGRERVQRGERLVRARAVRRVHAGRAAAADRRRPARRRRLPVRHGRAAHAVRAVPAGALRVRRPGVPARHPARQRCRSRRCCPTRSGRTTCPSVPGCSRDQCSRVRGGRRDPGQAGRRAPDRRADRLGGRRLHPRRRRRRADVRARHGHPAQRHGRRGDRALDGGDDRLRRAAGVRRTSGVRWSTSTPPVGSATRSPCRWRRWSPRAGRRCRSCPGAGSGTPAARWTSWSRSRAGAPSCPLDEIAAQLARRRRGDLRDHPDAGPGRPQALRAARRHRHRRVDPADRQLDHEQEDRGGHGRPGAGREGRAPARS